MAYFIGILDGSGDVWGVRIPDAPGIHGGGATPEEAIADAISALREVGAMLIAESKALPKPRTIEEILSDTDTPDMKAGETAVMIPLLLDSGRSVRAGALRTLLPRRRDDPAGRSARILAPAWMSNGHRYLGAHDWFSMSFPT